MSGNPPGWTVSPFVAEWVPRVACELGAPANARYALDLAMGEGRHANVLAEAGFTVFGVDVSLDRLRTAKAAAAARGHAIMQWAADLDTYPLPRHWCDLLFCSRFLLRARWSDLRDAVSPGGFVVYETFTTDQLTRGTGPRSPDHLLHPGELRRAFAAWDVVFSEEVGAPAAMARLVARKPPGV